MEDLASTVFRRRIRLIKHSGTQVTAGVEDDFHAFKLTLEHDGHNIVRVVGEALRYPLDTCVGSLAMLSQLEGVALSPDPRALGIVP